MTVNQSNDPNWLNNKEFRVVTALQAGQQPRDIAREHRMPHDVVDKTLRRLELRKIVQATRRADGSLSWSVSPEGPHRLTWGQVVDRQRAARRAGR